MSKHSTTDPNRWEELQVARLLFGLTAEEQAEYDDSARQMPAEELDPFDTVVANLDVVWSNMPSEPLPEHLRRAIRVRAEQELATKPIVSVAKPTINATATIGVSQYLPWLVSAACLMLAVFTWVSNRPAENAGPDVAQLRAELIAAKEGLVQANWSAGTTPIGNATGDVVWSGPRQQGFMRFRGLPVNTPTKEQYQLWIFDKNQSDKTPIDGGVFDIATSEEVIIPIHAKLRVQDAFMFAVTIEKPGGVVVSSRERLPLLAKVE
ncbi:Anti-sigma-K factor rskA [Anatilimnocola aggregata]|uniref:Anti-sigma-K factor rskA n=1 Tax=Anatilimnocola aggregata TaxID=2528021 RepID=A0A517YGF0_9BACT|nr:anti-sigma factor [Anatilimnocola aggregata]QDU29305.1 Anti-sigma-K factor rskA [Anatilimnocola aggregata]